MKGLIGYTGFVGGSLQRLTHFDKFYNSKNIESIQGESFNMLVCAGAPGKKWYANQNPAEDLASIATLIHQLSKTDVKKCILISTVDVYEQPFQVDEETQINRNSQSTYGFNRLLLEDFVSQNFEDYHIIRLPALFGKGLRKNFIFDLIHNNLLDAVHPKSEFQFYNMENLWNDITNIINNNLSLVNFATEPISTGEIADQVDYRLTCTDNNKIVKYDFYTKYGSLLGSDTNTYLYSKNQILPDLIKFIKDEKLNLANED